MAATGVFEPGAEPPSDLAATNYYAPGQTGHHPGSGNTETYAGSEQGAATGVFTPTEFAPPAGAGAGATPRGKETSRGMSRCGHYILKHFHAKGGMGEVWVAEDPDIGRPVALKRMLSHRPDQQHRFRVEAQVTGQLEHPGIVPVHELGVTEEGHPYYVMKFVRGRTLKKVVEEFHAQKLTGGAREVEQLKLLQMFLSLCQTVAYSHSRGILHRDLKPENVMLGSYGETILLDWGIAKVMGQPDEPPRPDGEARVRLADAPPDTGTLAGAIMGTPSYMAPEVAAGLNDDVDQRSDIYLLGATLYEILSGRQPRSGKTVFEVIKRAREEPPRPLRTINPLVPRALEAICSKAMAHRMEDRYQTASELAEDIQRFVAGEPVSAHREDVLTRAWRWAKRHRLALGRSAAAVLIGAVSLFAYTKVREANQVLAQQQARLDLNNFRRLADEANFFAATNDPISEHTPYYDQKKGEASSGAALAIAAKWGPALEKFPAA